MSREFPIGIRTGGLAVDGIPNGAAEEADAVRTAIAELQRNVRRWDRIGVDYAVIDDAPTPVTGTLLSRLVPTHVAGYLAATTERIGLVPVINPAFQEPYYVAKRLATLDLVAGGRIGWLLQPDYSGEIARLFGRQPVEENVQVRSIVLEFVQLAAAFWHSWEPGAVIRDRENDLYFDVGRIHRVEHQGAHFTVRGIASIHSDSQGTIPVLAAHDFSAGAVGAARIVSAATRVNPSQDAGAEGPAGTSTGPVVGATAELVVSKDSARADVDLADWIVREIASLVELGWGGVLLRPDSFAVLDEVVLPALAQAGYLGSGGSVGTLTSLLHQTIRSAPEGETA